MESSYRSAAVPSGRTLASVPATILLFAPVLALAVVLACGGTADADQRDEQIQSLQKEIDELRRHDAAMQKRLDEFEQQSKKAQAQPAAAKPAASPAEALDAALEEMSGGKKSAAAGAKQQETPQSALDAAIGEIQAPAAASATSPAIWSRPVGGMNMRLIDLSMDILAAGGGSTASDAELALLQGGDHDPHKNGFTLQQAELSLMGAVDPYFTSEAHVVFSTDNVELEEAFFDTTALPYGLQLEGGYFLTEFGRINPTHPHAWNWIDEPVINSRLFGPDGLRSPGMRVGWLMPVPWFSELHFGIQNANEGSVTKSFNADEGIGGRPAVDTRTNDLGDLLYLLRWDGSWSLPGDWTLVTGASGLHGPNSTGGGNGTWIYGVDTKLRWRPATNFRGWPFFLWQTELMQRDFDAGAYVADPADPAFPNDLPGGTLHDWGGYTEGLYGFTYGWAAGLRLEYADGSGRSVIDGSLASRSLDPDRAKRYRITPLLVWHPTHFSRVRLQYDYDWADNLDHHSAHTVWLSAEVSYGQHPAHNY